MDDTQTWTLVVGSIASPMAVLAFCWGVIVYVTRKSSDELKSFVRAEIGGLDAKLTAQIGALDSKLTGQIAEVDNRLGGQIAGLRSEMHQQFGDVKADIASVKVDIAWLKGVPPGPRAV